MHTGAQFQQTSLCSIPLRSVILAVMPLQHDCHDCLITRLNDVIGMCVTYHTLAVYHRMLNITVFISLEVWLNFACTAWLVHHGRTAAKLRISPGSSVHQ